MMHVKPPNAVPDGGLRVFLAGSIEMGTAWDWQDWLASQLEKLNLPLVVMNPRRDDWDSSWVQEESNPQFNEQVTWELDGIENSDYILFYFDPATKSPVTLAELGYVLGMYKMVGDFTGDAKTHSPTIIVVCPNGFWKNGNVDIMCRRAGIPVYEVLAQGVLRLVEHINSQLDPEPPIL